MMLAHFTIASRDPHTTAEFYQQILQWPLVPRPANVDETTYWLDIGNGQQLHVLLVEDFEVSPFEAEFGRHFAFFVSRDRMDTIRERLIARGIEIIPPIRPTPFERWFFREPNGYWFELIDQDGYVIET